MATKKKKRSPSKTKKKSAKKKPAKKRKAKASIAASELAPATPVTKPDELSLTNNALADDTNDDLKEAVNPFDGAEYDDEDQGYF